jgi:hypothetical protein
LKEKSHSKRCTPGRTDTWQDLREDLELVSSLRWLLMREGRVIFMYDTEGKAVKSAMFYNDLYETDKYFVKKIDKRKDDYRLYEYEGE